MVFQQGRILTVIKLSFRVLDNVSGNAGLIRALRDSILEHIQQISHVLVTASAELLGLVVHLCENPKQRDIVLPVIAGAAEVGDATLDSDNLLKKLIVDVALNAEAVVEGERGVQSKALEIRGRVDVLRSILAILEQLSDACRGLQINNGHVRLNGGTVQRGGGSLATTLARLVPGGGSDRESLRA